MNPLDNSTGVRGPGLDGPNGPNGPNKGASARRGAGVSPASGDDSRRGGANPVDSGESVSLTRTASNLLALETKLRELPDIDQARVEAVRRAIDEGRYVIDTRRIVDSLLQSERELR